MAFGIHQVDLLTGAVAGGASVKDHLGTWQGSLYAACYTVSGVENPDGTFTVYLHASAHDGEANASLIKLLAKHFKIPKTTITITRGAHSRHKIVEF
jgi:hypothetical protein